MPKRSSIQPSPSTVRVAQLALVFAAINAIEPMHLDDAAFFLFAQHIAQTPLDPYGFSLIWDGDPMSAMDVLAPPVFLYYWAGLIKLFGVSPLLWKLGCFPIYFLYIASLRTVLSRFAPSILWPALLLIAFSPMVLPGANMMLEIPVQSLFFAGLACFILACERASLWLLAASAMLVALCIEAKYTGLIIVPTLVLYGVLNRKYVYAICVSLGGIALFAAAEFGLYLASGASHFLVQSAEPWKSPVVPLTLGLLGQLGGGGLGLLGFALIALQVQRRWVVGILVGWLAILLSSSFVTPDVGRAILRTLPQSTGFAILAVMLLGIFRLNRIDRVRHPTGWPWDEKTLFLSLWLLGEIVFYYLVSPFPAMRRLIGIGTAGALLFARWIETRDRKPEASLVAIATAASLLLTGIFVAIDLQWARSVRESVAWGRAQVGDLPEGRTIWYHGVWGFKYYAMEAGMQAIVAGRSDVAKGDYLLVPSAGIAVPKPALDLDQWEEVARYRGGIAANLKMSGYYYGVVPLSVGRRETVRVGLYRKL